MDRAAQKPTLTPPEPLTDAGFEGGGERWPTEPKVGGSSNRLVTAPTSGRATTRTPTGPAAAP